MRFLKLITLAGLILAVTATAGAVTIPFNYAYNGPIYAHVENRAMGSVYNGLFLGGAPAPTGQWLNPALLQKAGPTGGVGGEDGWGVFVLDQMWKGSVSGTNNITKTDQFNPLYTASDLTQTVEIVGMYRDRVDLWVMFNESDGFPGYNPAAESQDIEFAGDINEIYAQTKGTFDAVTQAFLGNPAASMFDAGSSGRVAGTDNYRGIGYDAAGIALPAATSTLAIVLAGEPGYMGSDTVAHAGTEGAADFWPAGGGFAGDGHVGIFYSVTGGAEALIWNTDLFDPTKLLGGPFNTSDFKLIVTDTLVIPS